MPQRAAPRHQQRKMAFSVGLLIVGMLALLLFIILWLRHFSVQPAFQFFVRFLEPPYITAGSPIYYRGLRVGKVGNVALTPQGDAVLVRLDVYEKSLRLPRNARITINTEGITGIVYVTISYPLEEPPSPLPIQDGMIVQGVEPFSLDRLQRELTRLIEEGKMDELVAEARNLVRFSKAAVLDYRQAAQKGGAFFDKAGTAADASVGVMQDLRASTRRLSALVDRNEPELRATLTSFRQASDRVSGVLGDASTTNGLQQATQSVTQAMNQWGKASTEIEQTAAYVRQELQQTGLIRTTHQTAQKWGLVSDQANTTLVRLGVTSDLRPLGTVVQNANRTINRFDCIQSGVSDILQERFLFFKLAFGRPGSRLDVCRQSFNGGNGGLQPVSQGAAP